MASGYHIGWYSTDHFYPHIETSIGSSRSNFCKSGNRPREETVTSRSMLQQIRAQNKGTPTSRPDSLLLLPSSSVPVWAPSSEWAQYWAGRGWAGWSQGTCVTEQSSRCCTFLVGSDLPRGNQAEAAQKGPDLSGAALFLPSPGGWLVQERCSDRLG